MRVLLAAAGVTVAAIAVVAGLATQASAQTREGQFAVRAQVVKDCQVTTQDLNFGTYSSERASTGSTPLSVRCTPGTGAVVKLDGGGSGNPQARRMTGPANLNYQLYRDAGFTDPLNSAGQGFQLRAEENTGQAVIFTVFGQIPAGQQVPAGNYTDIIRVEVQF